MDIDKVAPSEGEKMVLWEVKYDNSPIGGCFGFRADLEGIDHQSDLRS